MLSNGLGVEVQVTGDGCPLSDATAGAGVTVDCRPPPQLRDDGHVLLRMQAGAIEGGEAVADHLDADSRVSHIFLSSDRHGVTIRCLSTEPCVLHTLTDAGFLPTNVRFANGTASFKGEVVGRDVLKNVLHAAGEAVGVHVRNIYQITPDDDADDVPPLQGWNLTPSQVLALETAYELGYFDVPRKTTAVDVADDLGISKSAFLQRLQRAERAIMEQILNDETASGTQWVQ